MQRTTELNEWNSDVCIIIIIIIITKKFNSYSKHKKKQYEWTIGLQWVLWKTPRHTALTDAL